MAMIKATGSQIIVKLLEAEGIKIVAGIPGGSILPLYDELNRSSIKHVLVRHEQAAGFIAQGMTRSTGIPAVCMATSGPGAMNLLTAIADARSDSVPIVAFTGQVNSSLIGTDAFQEADTFGLSFPITKHSVMVKDALDLLTVIPQAFALAISGRPGPVLIDVPRDVQTQLVEFEKWPSSEEIKKTKKLYLAQSFLTDKNEIPQILDSMAEKLLQSKKCVLYLGGGCNNQKASTALKDFVEKYNCAVVSSLMGLGVIPSSNPNNFGMIGMHGLYAANLAIHDADLVLACGVRFDDRATGLIKEFCPNASILHIDIDAAEINKILPASISLVADVAQIIPSLIKSIESMKKNIKKTLLEKSEKERDSWLKYLQKQAKDAQGFELGRTSLVNKDAVNPREFINSIPKYAKLAGVKEDDLIITTDVGQHQMWSAQYYPVEKARHFLTSASLGTMGFGLPAAIGAALANPSKKVVCISGDGSILMNIQELATLSELDLNITVLILQNGSLGMVRQQQEYLFEKNYSASIFQKVPDYVQIAKGFGIEALDVNQQMKEGSDWCKLAFSKGPRLIRLNIDMAENVLPFVKAGFANIDSIR